MAVSSKQRVLWCEAHHYIGGFKRLYFRMHNRKKPEKEPTEAEKNALKEKSRLYQSLVGLLWEKRRLRENSPETLAALSKLLSSNPDFYSLWNFRREVLISLNPDLAMAMGSTKLNAPEVRDNELNLTAMAIRRNPKSYGAWHHRLWIVDRFETDFSAELDLCREFLKADQRNFHCWNYRRTIFERSGFADEQEMEFCLEKIQENFSNYSAFHHRSIYIKKINPPISEAFETDWPMVENAIFTEPDDQSAWWYYQFLVTLGVANCGDGQSQWLKETLLSHAEVIKSLLELEPNCRWPLMILVFLADTLLSQALRSVLSDDEAHQLLQQRQEQLNHLSAIDPIHKERYRYLLQKEWSVVEA